MFSFFLIIIYDKLNFNTLEYMLPKIKNLEMIILLLVRFNDFKCI